MADTPIAKPGGGHELLIVGIALLVIGLASMLLFGFGTPGRDTSAAYVAWETGLTVGSSIFIGVGILLIVIAIVRRMRSKALKRTPDRPDGAHGVGADGGPRNAPPAGERGPGG
jgi:hypothetical protein